MSVTDPACLPLSLAVKLGSAVVHIEEYFLSAAKGSMAADFDRAALQTILDDPEVQKWIKEMGVLLPLKRAWPSCEI